MVFIICATVYIILKMCQRGAKTTVPGVSKSGEEIRVPLDIDATGNDIFERNRAELENFTAVCAAFFLTCACFKL